MRACRYETWVRRVGGGRIRLSRQTLRAPHGPNWLSRCSQSPIGKLFGYGAVSGNADESGSSSVNPPAPGGVVPRAAIEPRQCRGWAGALCVRRHVPLVAAMKPRHRRGCEVAATFSSVRSHSVLQ